MSSGRISRAVFGVLFLIGFAVLSIMRFSNSMMSEDVGKEEEPAVEITETVEQPQETEAPVEPTPTPTPEPTVDPNSPEGRALALGLPKPPEIDINSWEYILVNGDNLLPADYVPPEVVLVSESQCPVDSRIAEALMDMAEDTKAQGLSVYLSSGYRSYSEQAANFQRVCANNGVTDGKDAQGYYITMPAGGSEHQTGLCCDITDRYYQIKNSSLENTEMFKYMNANCEKFGFILRFPKDKGEITGVMYEPFHFRYVGVEAATYIKENNLCLEEFVALYTGE
ncbi:MAG: M15 family metallopeptidase [Oscillospiraceae bacterium]|nr:M15 family metallopeptidase [Oscillospiraceae bacterium]